MAISENTSLRNTSHTTPIRQPLGGLGFDLAFLVPCTWLMVGISLDGWAHNHISALETFFTPWHGVLYSGYLATAVFLLVVLVHNLPRGYAWQQALPAGYGLSLLGAGIFAVGGVLDLIWHTLFGIEKNVEALLSPTHLMLALGAVLIDLLIRAIKPVAERKSALRLFAFAVPVIINGMYFLGLAVIKGVSWSIHLWAGSIVMAGIIGLMLSYVLVPPQQPIEEKKL